MRAARPLMPYLLIKQGSASSDGELAADHKRGKVHE
jgi:hypothetical protein